MDRPRVEMFRVEMFRVDRAAALEDPRDAGDGRLSISAAPPNAPGAEESQSTEWLPNWPGARP